MEKYYSIKLKAILYVSFCALILFGTINQTFAQKKKKETNTPKEKGVNSGTVSALKFRNIGPAFASGRIADFAVNPNNHSEWYVGVASGNIWKTVNNGQTFKPVFEKYGTYSIGAMAMDPNNSNVVWAGTGENNHQRALAYGNGVYKTVDGGKSWNNMGLKESRHIGGLVIDPRNSDVVFVAAEGSAWGSGGDRGLYKTTDGGKNWGKVLEISENTGVNNVVIDPLRPNIMYATSEQRRRHVHTKIGGGPESAVYKSTDSGNTWRKLTKGLPSGNVGGMGIAVSPVNSNYVFIIAEAEKGKGGFYRSTDRGESWSKMGKHHASGQYYNEIYCDPINVDKLYSTETRTRVTIDGGKTWKPIGLKARHVDDHALWINPKDPNHFIIGGDGGVYITYDAGANYRHVSNLPITQYYRVGLDNSEPFYWVYGGTQDNNSMGGPSQNIKSTGVTSEEWVVTLGGDGFWNQIDPEDPNIVYSEYQYGNVYRFDKKSGERLYIKPQPEKDELTHRWNWNAPMFISSHKKERLYIAANKVFRTEDRGQTWTRISDDLTAQLDRTNQWPVMGKHWPTDAVAKDVSTSQYGTIVAMEESPKNDKLLYVGTDDGLIQITENATDAKATWQKVSSFVGVPANTYIADIHASNFEQNVVYAAFDNRKRDDFKPYLMKSTNKGKSWTMITNGLPENGTVHTIEQDYINKDLLFCGTEFGVFFTINGGAKWVQLKAGIPTIAVRDMAIQERESDLVLATFGRGFYVLDDYSPLREVSDAMLEEKGKIFPIKDAKMYLQKGGHYGQGATYYKAKNAPFGATFTYYVGDIPKTDKQLRVEKEKELFKNSSKMPIYDWRTIEQQNNELKPYLLFTITDTNGNTIRKIAKAASKGMGRITWDLRFDGGSVRLSKNKFNPLAKTRGRMLVMPGTYKVAMGIVAKGVYSELAPATAFKANALNNTTLPAPDRAKLVAFQQEISELSRVVNGTAHFGEDLIKKVAYLKQAALQTAAAKGDLMQQIIAVEKALDGIRFTFEGAKGKASGEEIPPQQVPLNDRLGSIIRPHWQSTSAVTKVQTDALAILKEEFTPVYNAIKQIAETQIPAIEKALEQAKAGYTPGRLPNWE